MSTKALSDYTFASRYARYDKTKKRRETWHEAIERVKGMHLTKYPMVADDINWAFEHVHNKIALGSQRALQFGGDPILIQVGFTRFALRKVEAEKIEISLEGAPA